MAGSSFIPQNTLTNKKRERDFAKETFSMDVVDRKKKQYITNF